jgi:OOP family OmpA-OmpF porin
LNQIVEKSASWRSIRWRIEARATGRPFTEILLSRSLLYSVDQVFLIHRKSGLLLAHVASDSAVVKDADMVSGMFTAIQDFVSDSFTEAGQALETIDVGRYKLWIQYGPKALIVGAVGGTAPAELKGVFRSAVDRIHQTLPAELEKFKQGDTSVFAPARPYLQSCLLGRKSPDRKRNVALWVLVTATAALIIGLIGWYVRNQRRWDDYVDALRRQQGVVVIQAKSTWSGGRIEGLKDPDAPEPARLLNSFDLDPAKVQFAWQPYLSLNTPFAADRQFQADVNFVQRQVIRFELGSAKLPLAEISQIDELAGAMQRIRQARPSVQFEISGHTDEVGTPEDNVALSLNRASTALQALAAQGIPLESMTVKGAGNAEPLRSGGGEWDRAANRSVSIRAILSDAAVR